VENLLVIQAWTATWKNVLVIPRLRAACAKAV
jgi:hypothetical protein